MSPLLVHQYHAYLLRLWRDDDRTPWRATLEDAQTAERHAFADPEQLWLYIRQLTALEEPCPTCHSADSPSA